MLIMPTRRTVVKSGSALCEGQWGARGEEEGDGPEGVGQRGDVDEDV